MQIYFKKRLRKVQICFKRRLFEFFLRFYPELVVLYIKTRKSLITRYAILQKTSLFKPFYKIYLADCMSITHENRVIHKKKRTIFVTRFEKEGHLCTLYIVPLYLYLVPLYINWWQWMHRRREFFVSLFFSLRLCRHF